MPHGLIAAQARACTGAAASSSSPLSCQQPAAARAVIIISSSSSASMLGRLMLRLSRSGGQMRNTVSMLRTALREPLSGAGSAMGGAGVSPLAAGTITTWGQLSTCTWGALGGATAAFAPASAAAASPFAQVNHQLARTKISARATRKSGVVNGATLDATAAQKDAALAMVMKEINDKFGKGSLMTLGDVNLKVDTISSGALTLDVALGGGFPRGRIVEIYGAEASGKTTLALHAMAEVQKGGGKVALVDAEHAFDPLYAKRLGLDVQSMLLCQPDYGEMGLDVVDSLIRSSAVDLIVVDSVAALTPRAEVEGEVGMQQIGLQARMMSQVLRKLVSNASRANCTVIFINQLRQKVGIIYGNPEVTPGGNSLKYYASVRVDVRKKAAIKAPKSEAETGIRVRAKVVKNKVAPPYRLAEFDILFNSGISAGGCLLDVGEKLGQVVRRGSHYYYGEDKLGNGRDNALAFLAANAEIAGKLEAEIRDALREAGSDTNEWYDAPSPSASATADDNGVLSGADDDDAIGEVGAGAMPSAAAAAMRGDEDVDDDDCELPDLEQIMRMVEGAEEGEEAAGGEAGSGGAGAGSRRRGRG